MERKAAALIRGDFLWCSGRRGGPSFRGKTGLIRWKPGTAVCPVHVRGRDAPERSHTTTDRPRALLLFLLLLDFTFTV
jgi:hypothetical protein